MDIEYEATFSNIDKDNLRTKLKALGAKLLRENFMMKRVTFNLPSNEKNKWLRVRDEGDIIRIIEKNFEICRCDTEEPVIFKMRDHPFLIGVKFHPEYKSRPGKAHPLIKQLIKIAASKKNIAPKII